jgi:hypothetical protein
MYGCGEDNRPGEKKIEIEKLISWPKMEAVEKCTSEQCRSHGLGLYRRHQEVKPSDLSSCPERERERKRVGRSLVVLGLLEKACVLQRPMAMPLHAWAPLGLIWT